MGAVWSSEPFESQCVVTCDSNDTKGRLQTALAQLPEYNGFSIALQSTLKPTDLSNACDVDYTYRNAATGYAERDQRRVTFSGAGCAPVVGTTRSGLMYAKQRVTKEAVNAYYRELANYNQRWNAGGWQADGATYNPPLPSWGDPVFTRNVGLYNDNLRRVSGSGGVFDKTKSGSLTDELFQQYFQKYIAPTPGAPTPPEMSNVLMDEPSPIIEQAPPTFQDIVGGGDENTGGANGLANTAAASKNLNTYESLIAGHIDRAGPDYDPPKDGDSYETLLIKFNKAYDIVAGKRTGSMNMNSASENRSAFYKRFIGRGLPFPIPEPQVPLTRPVEGVMKYNYRPYTFNDRQSELIEYCPVVDASADKTRLKVNFCAALGFHENITLEDGKTKRCGTGDCCIPMAPMPAYEEPKPGPPRPKKPAPQLPPGYERLDPYTPESIANDTGAGGTYFGDSLLPPSMQRRPPPPKKTASACPGPKEYVIPGKRYYVESAPTRAQNAKKQLEYIMTKPVDSCSKKPAGKTEGFVAQQHAAQLKGSQQEENSKKMAALRGMGF